MPVTTPSIVTVWPLIGLAAPLPWIAWIGVTSGSLGSSLPPPLFCGLAAATVKSALLSSLSAASSAPPRWAELPLVPATLARSKPPPSAHCEPAKPIPSTAAPALVTSRAPERPELEKPVV